jgi:hypothetical protein
MLVGCHVAEMAVHLISATSVTLVTRQSSKAFAAVWIPRLRPIKHGAQIANLG